MGHDIPGDDIFIHDVVVCPMLSKKYISKTGRAPKFSGLLPPGDFPPEFAEGSIGLIKAIRNADLEL